MMIEQFRKKMNQRTINPPKLNWIQYKKKEGIKIQKEELNTNIVLGAKLESTTSKSLSRKGKERLILREKKK